MKPVFGTFQEVVRAINGAGSGAVIICESERLRRHAFRYAQFRGCSGMIRIKSGARLCLIHSDDSVYEGESRRSKAELALIRH